MLRLIISWAAAEPDRLAARLAALGFSLIDRRLVAFPAGEIRLLPIESGRQRERLLDPRWEPAPEQPAAPSGHPNEVRDMVALGWATVDTDRATAAQPDADFSFSTLPDDEQLGARVRGSLARRPATLVLEPATEGRLAATLVRGGEGPAALYLVAGAGGLERLAAAGWAANGGAVGAAAIRPGPLGPALLLPGGPVWGPHLLVVAAAATALEGRTAGTITP